MIFDVFDILCKTGTAMQEKRSRVVRITTGSDALDTLLGGGIETAYVEYCDIVTKFYKKYMFILMTSVLIYRSITEVCSFYRAYN